MGLLFIFLSSMFLSACPVPLRLCRAVLFASLRFNGPSFNCMVTG